MGFFATLRMTGRGAVEFFANVQIERKGST